MKRFSALVAAALLAALSCFVTSAPAHGRVGPGSQVVLAIDISGSMKGERIVAAKQAIRSLITAIDPRIELGIVTFSGSAKLEQAPTLDKAKLVAVVESLEVGGKTALYDAISVSVAALSKPAGTVIVLCDGEDNSSALSREQAIARAVENNVQVNVIGFRPSQVQRDLLRTIASGTDGVLITPDNVQELLDAFSQFAEPEPEPTVPSEPQGTVRQSQKVTSIPAALAGLTVLLAATSLALIDQRRTRRRISGYFSPRALARRSAQVGEDKIQRLLKPRVEAYVAGLVRRLDDAGLQATPRDWLTRQAMVAAIGFVVFQLVTSNVIVASILALLLGVQWSRFSISRSRQKIALRFEEELHSSLLVAASSLRAGLSLIQALESIAKEGEGEVSRQLRRAVAEVRMGSTMEDALLRVSERVQSEDLRWVVAALAIQREVGGSLSHILVSTAEMIGDRFALRREVRALSAEGRLSAQVLVAMPIVIFLLFFTTREEYISVLWTTPLGIVMFIVIGLLEFLGWLWINKLVKVKV